MRVRVCIQDELYWEYDVDEVSMDENYLYVPGWDPIPRKDIVGIDIEADYMEASF